MSRKHTVKEPASVITVGRQLESKKLLTLLAQFNAVYNDFSLIKVNGKKVK